MQFLGGSGGGADHTENREIIQNFVEKSLVTCKLLKIFMNYESIFLFSKLILIIINVTLVDNWTSLIILKEIKKGTGKSLRV